MILVFIDVHGLAFAAKRADRLDDHNLFASARAAVELFARSALVLVAAMLALDIFVGTHERRSHRPGRDDERVGDEGLEEQSEDKSDCQAFDGFAKDLNRRLGLSPRISPWFSLGLACRGRGIGFR